MFQYFNLCYEKVYSMTISVNKLFLTKKLELECVFYFLETYIISKINLVFVIDIF